MVRIVSDRITSVAVVSVLFLLAVAPPAAAESPDTSHAALGITLSLRAPVAIGSNDADVAYFVRLNEGESLDSALARGEVIATNDADDGRLLILGAIPGTYVAVAAAYRKTKSGGSTPLATGHPAKNVTVSIGFDPLGTEEAYRTYFARDFIESTMVSIGPDSFVYVGHLVVKQATGIAQGDEVQKHFQHVLEGKSAKRSGLRRKSGFVRPRPGGPVSTGGTPGPIQLAGDWPRPPGPPLAHGAAGGSGGHTRGLGELSREVPRQVHVERCRPNATRVGSRRVFRRRRA